MQFITEWTTPDLRRLVILSERVVATLQKYRQLDPTATEAGGILLGRRRGGHIEVTEATEPMVSDRRLRHRFVRNAAGHADSAIKAWEVSGGTVDYLGEWHSHPERFPTASALDRREWSKLVNGRPEFSILVLIVGTEGLYLEMISKESHQKLISPQH